MQNISQPQLFEFKPKLPQGFSYHANFISRREEIELLKYIQTVNFGHLKIRDRESKRGIAGFGVEYSFETGEVTQGRNIPGFLFPLREKVANWMGKKDEEFEEVLITEYQPGSAISWHKDASPFDVVVGISLLNSCKFKLRRGEKGNWENIDLEVEPRSAYVMNGVARWQWQHSIPPAKALRYSITFRTLRKNN